MDRKENRTAHATGKAKSKAPLTKSVLRSTDIDGEIEISQPEDEAAASDLARSLSTFSLPDECGPCKVKENSRTIVPEWYCSECDDYLCKDCASYHKAFKTTRNHSLITYVERIQASRQVPCGPCKETGSGKIVTSSWYCEKCDDFLCDDCKSYHKALKGTRDHALVTIEEKFQVANKGKDSRKSLNTKTNISQYLPKLEKGGKASREIDVPEVSHLKTATNLAGIRKQNIERKATVVHKYKVRLPDDKEQPDITGSYMISDSIFLLADRTNKCLKLFQSREDGVRVIEKKMLRDPVYGMGIYDDSEVAISLFTKIIRISVTGLQIKEKDTIKHKMYCTDIAYVSKDILVTACTGPHIVCSITLSGDILWSLSKDDMGRDLFSYPYSITINRAKTTAYVSDMLKDLIYKIDISGSHEVTTFLQLPAESGPRGLTLDAEDNIYVCNGCADTVMQISSDGVHSKTLLTRDDGLHLPQTISCAPDDTTFVVGSLEDVLNNGSSDFVLMFKMQ